VPVSAGYVEVRYLCVPGSGPRDLTATLDRVPILAQPWRQGAGLAQMRRSLRDACTANGQLARLHVERGAVQNQRGEEVARQILEDVKRKQGPEAANVTPPPAARPGPRESVFAWRDFLFVGDPTLLARVRAALP
jgi:hypothetical protein